MSYTPPPVGSSDPTSAAQLVPRALYRIFAKKASVGRNKAGTNWMATVGVQILSPATVTDREGKVAETSGIEGTMYFSVSEKNINNMRATIQSLGVALPASADSFDAYAKAMLDAFAEYLSPSQDPLTFDCVVQSKRESVTGAGGEPILDGAGQPILGREQPDFNVMNIPSNPCPKRLSAFGA